MDSVEHDWSVRNITVHRTATVMPGVKIENGVTIGPGCRIGCEPEIYDGFGTHEVGRVIIRKGAILCKDVVVDSGSTGVTVVGAFAMLMSKSHVGHDAVIGDRVRLSPHCGIGGHATIGDDTNIGLGAQVHQMVAVPKKCMIGMLTPVTKKAAAQMKPCETWVGNPAKKLGMNKKWIK